MIEFVIIFIAGGLVGFFLTYLIKKNMYSADQYVSREIFLDEKKQVLGLQDEKIQLSAELAKYKEIASNHQKNLKVEEKKLQDQYEQMKNEFENLSNKILDKTSEKFLRLNKAKLNEVLNPLGDKIKNFEKSVEEKYVHEIEGRTRLEEQIKHLTDLNKQISQDALNLTNALKGESKTRGDWGELQLQVLLENSGLKKDVNFQMRPTFTDEDGKKTQPDCIIILPDGKNYIIDSKVSLVAYDNYVGAQEDEEKDTYLHQHIESVKKHIKELSEKDYSSIYGINPPDYVFMFVPIEPAWFSAIGATDGELYSFALEKNIVLVSVTTLIATLRTVSFIWQQENQRKNVIEIARQSGALYDKFCNFIDDLHGVGKSIAQSQGKYDEAIKKLSTGKDNLIRKTERIKELGAKTKKSLSKELVDSASDEFDENVDSQSLLDKINID